jgi:two-component system, OmpR family, response regulator
MANIGKVHRLTPAGRKAWETQDPALPADYRRILGLVLNDTHSDVIRGNLRHFADSLIYEWLEELEELGLLESQPAAEEHDLDFTGSFKLSELIAEDKKRLARDAQAAGTSLARKGVYLAADRLKNRSPTGKPPLETVILIVEDDPDQLALAELRVMMARFVVRKAASAASLLETLQADGAPDLLLLDVMLPDGDGFEILAKLRAHPTLALLPIVMLTAKNEPNDIRKGLTLGADGYITKPYSKQLLVDTIRKVLVQEPPAAA